MVQLAAVRGQYSCIYMDAPWSYQDSTARGAAARHYPTMAVEELKTLPVPELAHPDGAHFWIWTTFPKIRDRVPHELIQHWGLRWVGEIVWDKMRIGPGRWLRSQAEVLILAVKGKPVMPLNRGQGNIYPCPDPLDDGIILPEVVPVKRTPKHSEKPEEFRALIERLSPGPRIELFARVDAPGWDRWGNEAPSQEGQCPQVERGETHQHHDQHDRSVESQPDPVAKAPLADGPAALEADRLGQEGPQEAGQDPNRPRE